MIKIIFYGNNNDLHTTPFTHNIHFYRILQKKNGIMNIKINYFLYVLIIYYLNELRF